MKIRALLMFLLMAAGVVEVPAAEKWLRLKSEHFEMISAVSERDSRDMLVELEQFRAMFLAVFRLSKANDPQTTIVVFKNKKAFLPYCPTYNGQPKALAGYCSARKNEVYLVMSGDAVWSSFGTLFHEFVHGMIAPRVTRIPVWLNEGLAELFETFWVSGDKVAYGEGLEHSVRRLRREKFIPMDIFLRVDHGSSYYNEADQTGMFYAQSWALLHFLMCSEDYKGTFDLGKLIQLSEEGVVSPEEALLRATGLSAEELKKKVEEYVRMGRYYKKVGTIPAKEIRAKVQARAAKEWEVAAVLLSLKGRVHKDEDVYAQLRVLAEKNPGEARLYEMLAEVSDRARDSGKVREFWLKAAECGSENPFVYVSLAKITLDGLRFMPDFRFPEEKSVQLRGWLDRAIELSPDYLEAYELLVEVEVYSQKIRMGAMARVRDQFDYIRVSSVRGKVMLFFSMMLWRYEKYEESLQYIAAIMRLPEDPPPVRKPGTAAPRVVKGRVEFLKELAGKFEVRVRKDMEAARVKVAAGE